MEKLDTLILKAATKHSQKIAFQILENNIWQRTTYNEVKLIVQKSTALLKNLNLLKSDRVIILSENKPHAMLAYLSVVSNNCTAILLDPKLPPKELEQLIVFCQARLILVSSEYESQISLITSDLPIIPILSLLQGYISPHTVLPAQPHGNYSDEVATILFTSGTTGTYKGVLLTHMNLISSVKHGQIATETTENDCMLTVLPIHHISPLIQNLMTLYSGACLTFIEKLDGKTILSTMQQAKPTISGFVPLLLEQFLNKIESEIKQLNYFTQRIVNYLAKTVGIFNRLSHLNLGFYVFRTIQKKFGGKMTRVICGGAKADKEVLRRLRCYGFNIKEAYGLTETTGPICSNLLRDSKLGTVGKPFAECDFSINNKNENGIGEICISGSQITEGYFRDPILTNERLINGVLMTGDLGSFDKGYLTINGRNKELIILPSAKKVFPVDVEKHYTEIPGIKEIAVFGCTINKNVGEQVCAAIVASENYSKDSNFQAQIKTSVYQRAAGLPAHYQIQHMFFVDELPKTAMMKVKRGVLAEKFQYQKSAASDNKITNKSEDEILQWMANWLKINVSINDEHIDGEQSFSYYGLSSLQLVEFCVDLQTQIKVAVHPALIWEYPSISKLAAHLAKETSAVTDNVTTTHEPAVTEENDLIAIIGMSCKLPGNIDSVEKFWQTLMQGQSVITEIPETRWSIEEFYDQDQNKKGKINTRFGGTIAEIDQFDTNFFEISPLEAMQIDPQHRLLLMESWKALERAGINPLSLQGSATGVYMGISTNDYASLQVRNGVYENFSAYYAIGNSLSAAAGRIAYFLGLNGVCKSIDTACSSSLVAINDACNDLKNNNVSMAIVGGVNAILSPITSIALSNAKMLAPDGRCKVFDADADGYVRSEGCGIVILKRLVDAKADKDTILAVIHSSKTNQDGRSSGLTAPNGKAQQDLFINTLKTAKISADQIDYIEAHGTGTNLGDPIEVRSIINVYGKNRSDDKNLYLGSVKANVGHLEAAAGIVGLIKTILVLQNKQIPPQINLDRLNPLIELNETPIKIRTDKVNLISKEHVFAAVNSFGFSGTNAQVILSNYNSEKISIAKFKPYYLITLTAKTKSALKKKIIELLMWLIESESIPELQNISYTLNACHAHFLWRTALIVSSIDDLKQKLEMFSQNGEKHIYKTPMVSGKATSHKINFNLENETYNQSPYLNELTLLMEKYLNGDSINWEELHRDESKIKIALPTYPFEKEKYWIKHDKINYDKAIENTSSDKVPIKLRFGSKTFFQKQTYDGSINLEKEINLNDSQFKYLKEHRIVNHILFPASGFLDILLQVGKEVFSCEHIIIENITIKNALILQDHIPMVLAIKLAQSNLASNRFIADIYSSPMDKIQGVYKSHVNAELYVS